MYKTRRQSKFQTLINAGFIGFESRAFSRVSPRVPYMKPMIKERKAEYDRMLKRALKQGIPEAERDKQWLTHIKRRYVANGWKRKGDKWGVTVAFRMLKAKEREYKYKHPAYESPWEKKHKSPADISAKLDATYEKYPRGKTYTKRQQPRRIEHLPEGGARFID